MAQTNFPARLFFLTCVGILVAAPAWAVKPADEIFPHTTKGFLVTDDYDQLQQRWNGTQLGALVNDPLMEPFIQDLREQLRDKLAQGGQRIGITLEDLQSVASGEVALGAIQPDGDARRHATAVVADVTDRQQEAQQLLQKIDNNMRQRNAQRALQTVSGVSLTVYTLPRLRGELESTHAVFFTHENQLVASDHVATAVEMARRAAGLNLPLLAEVEAYSTIMHRVGEEAGDDNPQLRWFIEPFGYVEVLRAARSGRTRRGTDVMRVLREQGFSAIRGMGGHVFFKSGPFEIQHHSFVFAPPQDDAEPNRRYHLAARMLQFPNTETLDPPAWVPRDLATFLVVNWEMQDAFHFSETLVNEFAGADVFRDVLEGIKQDPDGPQVDLEAHLVAYLSERAMMLTDTKLPITPKSERLLVAVEVTDADVVTQTVDRAMRADPDAIRREVDGQVIWEIVSDPDEDVPALQIDGPFSPFGAPPQERRDEDAPLLPNAAITVAHGHLIVASHIDLALELLDKAEQQGSLSQADDYQAITEALVEIGAGNDSFHYFSRTGEAYHTTYELLRMGQMPESETLLGRMLNRVFQPEERGVVRRQELDGQLLPPYEEVRHYFGPAGMFIRSEQDGWFAGGVVLSTNDQPLSSNDQPEKE